MSTGIQSINSSPVSALRYERIARLEAVLTVKEKQRRSRMLNRLVGIGVLALGIAGAAITFS